MMRFGPAAIDWLQLDFSRAAWAWLLCCDGSQMINCDKAPASRLLAEAVGQLKLCRPTICGMWRLEPLSPEHAQEKVHSWIDKPDCGRCPSRTA